MRGARCRLAGTGAVIAGLRTYLFQFLSKLATRSKYFDLIVWKVVGSYLSVTLLMMSQILDLYFSIF